MTDEYVNEPSDGERPPLDPAAQLSFDGMDADVVKNMHLNWRKVIEGDGGYCPCCARWGKVYKRNLNETICRSLVWLASASSSDWVDVPATAPRWLVRSNQLPSAFWWGLVERMASDDSKRKHSGMWRVTALGRQFVAGLASVPASAYTYAGKVEYMSEDKAFIKDCFGKTFDYDEVMRSPGAERPKRSD